ncbi:MAG: 16S rRNA (cytidine(1402)-2'-O)-methyltransferase [Clostridia bacterium]|nr:16S rRNA (cytidine(1402)-2'-O)-methyltransferase [Clostridia bacterium]
MLYLVATPIGNLKDVTLRALEVLNSVDFIACEDTRHSATFLSAHGIKKPLVAYHKFNEKEEGLKLVEELKSGKNVALISDAGMPVISDPGNVLVNLLLENNLEFTVIPGACAFVSALVLSGVDSSKFCFLGFLPDKQSRRVEVLEKYSSLDMPLIFYCAPHDVKNTIDTIYSVLGDRRAVAVREITKIYEEAVRFNLKDGYPKEPKGEFVIIVEGKDETSGFSALTPEEHLDFYLKQGLDKKEALKCVAKDRNVKKSDLYYLTIDK